MDVTQRSTPEDVQVGPKQGKLCHREQSSGRSGSHCEGSEASTSPDEWAEPPTIQGIGNGLTAPEPPGPPFPFLESPPELRIKVYRDLFCDKENMIRPQTHARSVSNTVDVSSSHFRNPFQLGSGLLTVCRQISDEAVPILYGEITFPYTTRGWSANSIDNSTTGFSVERLERIKYLHLEVDEHNGNDSVSATTLIDAFRYLSERGCSLKTLFLTFLGPNRECALTSNQERGYGDLWPLLKDVIGSEEFMAALVSLPVSQSLRIHVMDRGWAAMDTRPFFKALATAKGLRIKHFRYRFLTTLREDTVDLHLPMSEDFSRYFSCYWWLGKDEHLDEGALTEIENEIRERIS